MKVIYVDGDDDYAALEFCNSKITIAEAWEKANSQEDKIFDYGAFVVQALTFGPVDRAFIEFINDKFCDYDERKAHDFFIVRESSDD